MTTIQWANNVNTKFFEFKKSPKENELETSYSSGRTTAILKNTRFVNKISCKLKLSVASELPSFWTWYTNSLGGKTGAFRCSALGSEVYRFTAVPSEENTSRLYRILSLEIEEVY